MARPRCCVVFNPSAGTSERIEDLAAVSGREFQLEFCPTQGPGDAQNLALRAAQRGAGVVIAAGGDGTIREVVSGLMRRRHRRVGPEGVATRPALPDLLIVPMGTGNDLARTLNLPEATQDLMELLKSGQRRALDVLGWSLKDATGKRRRGWCINVIAGGFAAKLKRALTPEVKKFWGPLAYARAALASVEQLDHPHKIKLRLDGGEPQVIEAINVIIANARYAGGGMEVAPAADPSDGRLEVVAIMPGGLLDLAEVTAKLLMGEVDTSQHSLTASARSVKISARPPLPFNIDGDPAGSGSLSVEVVPEALHVLVPQAEAAG